MAKEGLECVADILLTNSSVGAQERKESSLYSYHWIGPNTTEIGKHQHKCPMPMGAEGNNMSVSKLQVV